MLIKKELFVQDGVQMCREYYGSDENNITAVVECGADEDTESTQDVIVTTEEIYGQILLNQADIAAKQQEQDAVLATILLNQIKGGGTDV